MKAYIAILISLLFSFSYNFEYENLSMNSPLTVKSCEDSLKFYQLSLREYKTLPNEIKVETQILDSKNPSTSTIGVHYEPFKKRNFHQVKKQVLGKPFILDSEFIKSVINENQIIYFSVYCDSCTYKINMIPSGEHVENKNFIQSQPLRRLIDDNINVIQQQKNDNITRLYVYSANGLSGLMTGFFMVIVTIIACVIMMKIYVHNTALVEQPLKLGRIEA